MPKHNLPKTKNSLGTNILILCIVLSLVGLGIVYSLDFFEVPGETRAVETEESVEFSIAASKLHAPKSWIETQFKPKENMLNFLELRLELQVNGQSNAVNVTLLPASQAAPSAYLLDALYIHNFASGPSEQKYGLVVKKLRNEAGFEDETIWYDALSANPFVAKCLTEKTAPDNAKNCITTVLVNKRVSALIQFEDSVLPNWRVFSVALDKQLATLTLN
ncbi:MAG: hypothetical protein ACJAZW_002088 [Maritalea sp.]|jgi:hypothetical protein